MGTRSFTVPSLPMMALNNTEPLWCAIFATLG
jgi:hypothetical protein